MYREVCLRGGHAAVGEAKWWKRVGSALAGVEAATRSTALGTVLKYAYEKWYCPPLFSRFLLTLCWGEGEREREITSKACEERRFSFLHIDQWSFHRSFCLQFFFSNQQLAPPPKKKKTGS